MDQERERKALVEQRTKRYMAQLLGHFEQHVQPLLSRDDQNGSEVDSFKGMCRQKITAVAVDTEEILTMPDGDVVNLAAVALTDSLPQRTTK